MQETLQKFLFGNKRRAAILLAVVGIVIYANALPGKMFWDDDDGILKNAFIQDWSYAGKYFSENLIAGAGFTSNYWRPMLSLGYSIEWHLWGSWAPGYHATNIFLHIANAILLFLLLRALFGRPLIAYVVALIFLVHPLQTEAITYVSGRGDPLSVLFMLLGMLAYLEGKTHKRFRFFAQGAYVLALMSKETAIVFPVLLLLIDGFLRGKTEGKRGSLAEFCKKEARMLAPFLAISGAYLLFRATVLNFQNTFNLHDQINPQAAYLGVRVLTFFKAIALYAGLLLFPHGLHMERVMALPVSLFEPQVLLGFLIFFGSAAFAIFSWRRRPEYGFAFLWFFICLSRASGILVPTNGLQYEHWLYFALAGFFLFLGFLLEDAAKKFSSGLFLLFTAFFIALLSFATIERNAVWRDPITFYNDVISYNKKSLRVWNNVGMAYYDVGDYQKAIHAYEQALALDLEAQLPMLRRQGTDGKSAPPYHNLGNAYEALGLTDKAISFYRQAIAVDQQFIFSYNALASLYLKRKNYAEALSVLKEEQKVLPSDMVQYNISVLEEEMRKEKP